MNSEKIQFARMAAAIEYLYDHAHEQPSLAAVANNKMGFILGLLRGCVGCFRLPESIES